MRKRASSFDLIFFLIPKEWDKGKGFDYSRLEFLEDFYDTKAEGWGFAEYFADRVYPLIEEEFKRRDYEE